MVAYATRDDVDEILTSIKQFKTMINEDLLAISGRIDRVERKAGKRFDQIDTRLGRMETRLDVVEDSLKDVRRNVIDTEGMLRVHISNPSAHRRAS